MMEDQKGRCAICSVDIVAGRHHVDHCHRTGKVRGILCPGCNMKLPILENPPLLASAQAYLRRHHDLGEN